MKTLIMKFEKSNLTNYIYSWLPQREFDSICYQSIPCKQFLLSICLYRFHRVVIHLTHFSHFSLYIFRNERYDCEYLAGLADFNLCITSTPLMQYSHLKFRHLLYRGDYYGTGKIYQISKPPGIWFLPQMYNWKYGIDLTFPYSFIDSISQGLIRII